MWPLVRLASLVTWIHVIWLTQSVIGNLIRFQPEIEYIYEFHSATELKEVNTLNAAVKVGFIYVHDLKHVDGQEIQMVVHSAWLSNEDDKVALHKERDFTHWFSFEILSTGEVVAVHYPDHDDRQVIEIKKGLVSLLSTSLQKTPQSQSDSTGWQYATDHEIGHEGQHEASYTAVPSSDGIVFSKVSTNNPLPYGDATHTHNKAKEYHYHSSLMLPTKIKIDENYKAVAEPSSGFDPYKGIGHVRSPSDPVVEFPEISALSGGEMNLVQQVSKQSPHRPVSILVNDTLHIKKFHKPKPSNSIPIGFVRGMINGNLTCVRKSPSLKSFDKVHCFRDLVSVLEALPDKQFIHVVQEYIPRGKLRRLRDRTNRLHMIDAVASVHTDLSQSILTDILILAPFPDKDLVMRFLSLSVGDVVPHSQHFLDAVEDIVFYPENLPEGLSHKEVQRMAVMLLGHMAGKLCNSDEPEHGSKGEHILYKIEEGLGIHDAWNYNQYIEKLNSTKEATNHNLKTVAWIEALGNAGHPRSFEHIRSFTNSSSTPGILKRAGLHSMRNYEHQEAANILFHAAHHDENYNTRNEAALLYRAHTHGDKSDVKYDYEEQGFPNGTVGTVYEGPQEMSPEEKLHRRRREVWQGFRFKLASPSLNWLKQYGGDKIGASLGITIKNELILEIRPLNGEFVVDALDEAFARVHLGILGINVDMFYARFCFNGYARYNVNVLKEVDAESVFDIIEGFEKLKYKITNNMKKGIVAMKDQLDGTVACFPKLFESQGNILEEYPVKLSVVGPLVAKTLSSLSSIDLDQLPESVKDLRKRILKCVQLATDLKFDILEFYDGVTEPTTITMPDAAEKIWKSVQRLDARLEQFNEYPKEALSAMFHSIFSIKYGVDAILYAKKQIEAAGSLNAAEPAYWWHIDSLLDASLTDIEDTLTNRIEPDMAAWVAEGNVAKDNVKALSGGTMTMAQLRSNIKANLTATVGEFVDTLRPLQDLLKSFPNNYKEVSDSTVSLKEAFEVLRKYFADSVAILARLFGPKAHPQFPRGISEGGGGRNCPMGFYPSTLGGRYNTSGIDLDISPPGSPVQAPFAGTVTISPYDNKTIELRPKSGFMRNMLVTFENVIANDSITVGEFKHVIAGTVIGSQDPFGPCSSHIHMAIIQITKTKEAEIFNTVVGTFNGDGDESASEDGASWGYVDPTKYLEPKEFEVPEWVQVCDDYKLTILGATIKAGQILELEPPLKTSTASARQAAPNPKSKPLAPEKRVPPRESSLATAGKKASDLARKNLGIPKPEFGFNPFKDFKIQDMKMGDVLSYLDAIGLDQTVEDLQNVITSLGDVLGNKQCKNPQQLTDEQLRVKLKERGKNSTGARGELISRWQQPDGRCPALLISLPKYSYCYLDPNCLGVECCLTIPIVSASASFKAYARVDPCKSHAVIGIDNHWQYTVNYIPTSPTDLHQEFEIPFEVPFFEDIEMRVTFGMESAPGDVIINLAVDICFSTGEKKCVAHVDIFVDSIFNLPECLNDGTITWPSMDLTDYLSREAVKERMMPVGQDALNQGLDDAMNYAVDELGLPLEVFEDTTTCDAVLAKNMADPHHTCDVLGFPYPLPDFPADVAESVYCAVSSDCLHVHVDCCVTVPIVGTFKRTFRATVELDQCAFIFKTGFQGLDYTSLLFALDYGIPVEQNVGSLALQYTLDHDSTDEEYIIDFSISICPPGRACLIKDIVDLLKGYRIPQQNCDSAANFSLVLPGGLSFPDFAAAVGTTTDDAVIGTLLQFLGLDGKIDLQDPCVDSEVAALDLCSTVTLPSLASDLTTCAVADGCQAALCCLTLNLRITTLPVKVSAHLDICQYAFNIGFGVWELSWPMFSYQWGKVEKLRLGKAVTFSFKIANDPNSNGFLVDFGITLCLPGEDTCIMPTVYILQETVVPGVVCDPNDLPGIPGGSLAEYAKQVGTNLEGPGLNAILRILKLDDIINPIDVCDRPQVVQNGWSRDCPVVYGLPMLTDDTVCTHDVGCLGVHCCMDFDIQVAKLSPRFAFVFDACQYVFTLTLGDWTHSVDFFIDFSWKTPQEFNIDDKVKGSFMIEKLSTSFKLWVSLEFCPELESECTKWTLFDGADILYPECDPEVPYTLPGDGTIAGFSTYLGSTESPEALALVLRRLKIEQYLTGSECTIPAIQEAANPNCPTVTLPYIANTLSCTIDDACLRITCCRSFDFTIATLNLLTWMSLDPCIDNFGFEVGFETWHISESLSTYTWGTERTERVDEGNVIISYTYNQNGGDYNLALSVNLCDTDDTCTAFPVLEPAVGIPGVTCSKRKRRSFPIDGSYLEISDYLHETLSGVAVDMTMQKLELYQEKCYQHSDDPVCEVGIQGSNSAAKSIACPQNELPHLKDTISCHNLGSCTGFTCCTELDRIITRRPVSFSVDLDVCNFQLSLGVDKWNETYHLFNIPMATDNVIVIEEDVWELVYRISKDTDRGIYLIDLTSAFCLGAECRYATILDRAVIAIPKCEDTTELPGGGTIAGFVTHINNIPSQFSIDAIVRRLGLQDTVNGKSGCRVLPSQNGCEASLVSSLDSCVVTGDTCTKIQCCRNLDLSLAMCSVTTWVNFDPCDLTFSIGVEKYEFDGDISNYAWGTEKILHVTDALKILFKVEKHEDIEGATFVIDMGIRLSIDKISHDVPVFSDFILPMPECRPGYGVETTVGDVSQSAYDLVVNRLGVSRDLLLPKMCKKPPMEITPTKKCPGVRMPADLEDYCSFDQSCAGIGCCLTLDLGVISRTFTFWMKIDECDGDWFRLGFEKWHFKEDLSAFTYNEDHERNIGGVQIKYRLEHPGRTTYVADFSISLCFPEEEECMPVYTILKDAMIVAGKCSPSHRHRFTRQVVDQSENDELECPNTWEQCRQFLQDKVAQESYTLLDDELRQTTFPSCEATHVELCEEGVGNSRCAGALILSNMKDETSTITQDPRCIKIAALGMQDKSIKDEQLSASPSSVSNFGPNRARLTDPYFWMVASEYPSYPWIQVDFVNPVTMTGIQTQGSNLEPGLSLVQYRNWVTELLIHTGDSLESLMLIMDEGGSPMKFKANTDRITIVDIPFPEPITARFLRIEPTAWVGRVSLRFEVFGCHPGGTDLINFGTNPDDDSDIFGGLFIAGGGFTNKGYEEMTVKIATMSISDLIALIDSNNIDPMMTFKLSQDLRNFMLILIDQVVEPISPAQTGGDIFTTCDFRIGATIDFGEVEKEFFEYSYSFFLGYIIHIQFWIGSQGLFQLLLPVEIGIMSFTGKVTLIPNIALEVHGGVRVGFLLYGECEVIAEIFSSQFPFSFEASFYKFPLSIGVRLDFKTIPLTITMRGLVTVTVPFFGWRTILYSAVIFKYSTPPYSGTLFHFKTEDPDGSPPEVTDYVTQEVEGSGRKRFGPAGRRKRQTQSTGKLPCSVEQIPNLDYTNPAFLLALEAFDDKSTVKYLYSIGRSLGGFDVVDKVSFNGPSELIYAHLPNGIELHFTVFVRNTQGKETRATCVLPTYDSTPPFGRIDAAFRYTSNPTILMASAVIHDESPIIFKEEAVGFGVRIWGDQAVPWRDADMAKTQIDPASMGTTSLFTDFKRGKLYSDNVLKVVHVQKTLYCAHECLSNPKCLSFNYKSTTERCELLADVRRQDSALHIQGDYIHSERLGVGHAMHFNHNNVDLIHGQLYYVNMYVINDLGYETFLNSIPTMCDLSPPEPGLIANASFDETVNEPCADYVLDEWETDICFTGSEHTKEPNHRTIIDGEGSFTVFNGLNDLVEVKYSRINTYMGANWVAFHDFESGIYGYTWAVGDEVCGTQLTNGHKDPHRFFNDQSQWTYEGLLTNVNLEDKKYYVTVRAVNKVDFGSPMAVTVCHSIPYGIDNSPPLLNRIYNVSYNTNLGIIYTTVNASDPHSDLKSLDLALGLTKRDTFHLAWTPVLDLQGLISHLVINFLIPDGKPGWVRIRAVNNVELVTTGYADTPILVDRSPPVAGKVNDGDFIRHDQSYTAQNATICANWQDFYDAESGIAAYLVGVGTTPGDDDILAFTQLNKFNYKMCSVDLLASDDIVSLQHNRIYYSTVFAYHGSFDRLNVSATSDGVLCDLTEPIPGIVLDGADLSSSSPTDFNYSSKPAVIDSIWQNFVDPESGIAGYMLSIFRKPTDTMDGFQIIYGPETQTTEHFTGNFFSLDHKDKVKVTLRAENGAGAYIDQDSDGFLVDLTAPVVLYMRDGSVPNEDKDFQSNRDSLSVNWAYEDVESDVASYHVSYYEVRQGIKQPLTSGSAVDLEVDKNVLTHTLENLNLKEGRKYLAVVKATNGAGLISSHETSGVKIDSTPPQMIYTRAGVVDGMGEQIRRGYILQSDTEQIAASWLAIDGESGIEEYLVSVGTTEFGTDVQDFQSFGVDIAGFITGLNLALTDTATCNDRMFTPGCAPVYYVCAKAANRAGMMSAVSCSTPIWVTEADRTGYITDGAFGAGSGDATEAEILESDVDEQQETTVLTMHFQGFFTVYGISDYMWSVGTAPGVEDIQSFTNDGIAPADDELGGPGLASSGKAQSAFFLEHGKQYYTTVKAFTNNDDILQSTSDGFIIDRTPPQIELNDLQFDNQDQSELYITTGHPLYKLENNLEPVWNVTEEESTLVRMFYQTGQYPTGADIISTTATNLEYIPPFSTDEQQAEDLTTGGLSNIMTISAFNSVGLRSHVTSVPMVVDDTPPIAGKVDCPAYITSRGLLTCDWSYFVDAESGITSYQFSLGTEEGNKDLFSSEILPASTERFEIRIFDYMILEPEYFYANVEATNAVGMVVGAYSQRINIADTTPSYGLVIELDGIHVIDGTDPSNTDKAVDCSTDEDCLSFDAVCIPANNMPQVAIVWQPFKDEQIGLDRYEVALGTAPGGSQLVPFTQVPLDSTSYIFHNVDLYGVNEVYASVRAYNKAGLSSTAISNGAYVSTVLAGLPPEKPFTVWDGIELQDMDSTTSLTELSASWDFSGDSCPMVKYEWAIHRVDGVVMQEMTDVGTDTSATNDTLQMSGKQSFYVIVRATNMLGLTFLAYSDGIEIDVNPLLPGNVYDGDLLGFDLNIQGATDRLSVNWDGFDVNGGGISYTVSVGSDRRYENTRNDVVPLTLVGTNTSTMTFENLALVAGSKYYVTLIATSPSLSTVSVISNGIIAGVESDIYPGEITVPEWINSLSTVQFTWEGFKSSLPIIMYYVGIGNDGNKDAAANITCEDVIKSKIDPIELEAIFDIYPMQKVGEDTALERSDMSFFQNTSYFAAVIAVNEGAECNTTTATFWVDVTPPTEGRMRTGPFFDMPVTYADSNNFLEVWWEGYFDEESDIRAYSFQLLKAPSCTEDTSESREVVVDWIERLHNHTVHMFVDLKLENHVPYYVLLRAENHAGGTIETLSSPVILDFVSVPRIGLLVDGNDIKEDITHHAFTDRINGTFLHMAEPNGPDCVLEDLAFDSSGEWDVINTAGLWNVDPQKWKIKHMPDKVNANGANLALTIQRDTQQERLLTGAIATDARIVGKGGKYEVDIKAAPPEGFAITSIIFWDGPRGVVGEFDEFDPDNWRETLCACCFDDPIDELSCYCNCTLYFLGHPNATLPDIQPPIETSADTEGALVVDPDEEAEIAMLPDPTQKGRPQRACGIQLNPAGTNGVNNSWIVMWCRYHDDIYPLDLHVVSGNMKFDPSKAWHNYKFVFQEEIEDVSKIQWSFKVYADDEFLIGLDGTPIMSSNTQLVFHVFNKDNYVPPLEDPFFPVTAVAEFKNLKMPPPVTALCRYAQPFRGGATPIIRYLAGVGSSGQDNLDDVVPFEEVYTPCVPCIHACDTYVCDGECSRDDVVPITFALTDINTPVNDTLGPGTTSYYLKVKAVLGSGVFDYAVSNGYYVDNTQPDQIAFVYIDENLAEFEPVLYQSSNSTIKVIFNFEDLESEIKEFWWAIGTFPGGTDLQDFTSIGQNRSAKNSNLEGILEDKQMYYVTMKCVNGAGLETLVEEEGIEVLLYPVIIEEAVPVVLSSEPFDGPVFPTAVKASDPSSMGACWESDGNPDIAYFKYCVGTSETKEDDIVPCTTVGNLSGCAEIANGEFTMTLSDGSFGIYGLTDFLPPSPNATNITNSTESSSESNFNMPPGSSLYHKMKVCNLAKQCKVFGDALAVIIGEGDAVLTSDGGDLSMSLTRKRRKRDGEEQQFDLNVATVGGMAVGQTMLVGTLSREMVSTDFGSAMSPDTTTYISNPNITITYVSRELETRVVDYMEPFFYASILGQMPLNGVMVIEVTFKPGVEVGDMPKLLYWDPERVFWSDASKTCGVNAIELWDKDTRKLTVEVCHTRGEYPGVLSRRKRQTDSTATFFRQETEFVVASTLNALHNDQPEITNLPTGFAIQEDGGSLGYKFKGSDPDGDDFTFALDPASSHEGTVTLEPDGTFTYQPPADWFGNDTIHVMITDDHWYPGLMPLALSKSESFTIEVMNANDNAVLFAAQYAKILTSTILIDENSAATSNQFSVDLGAYDADGENVLTIDIMPANHGSATLGSQVRSLPSEPADCNTESQTTGSLPCGLTFVQSKSKYSWVMTTLTYQPEVGYSGLDQVRVIAKDNNGAFSQLLIVSIEVVAQTQIIWQATKYSAYEFDESVTMTIQRSGNLARTSSVDVSTVDMEALASGFNPDYSAVAGSTIAFDLEESEKTVTISIINDDELELTPEKFKVMLSNAVDGHIDGSAEAVVTIHDDESTYEMKSMEYTVAESDKSIDVYVTRKGYLEIEGSVTLEMTSVTASSADYTRAEPTIIFMAKQTESFVTVEILEDEIDPEDPEVFKVSLLSATSGFMVHPNEAVITITNSVPDLRGQGTAYFFASSMTLADAQFFSELADSSSDSFTQLAEQFKEMLISLFDAVPGEQMITVEEFTASDSETIVVNFIVASIGNDDETAFLQVLTDAIASGQFGAYTVEADQTIEVESIKALPVSVHQSSVTLPDEPYSPALADPESQEFMQLAEEIQQALEEVYSAVSGDQHVSNIKIIPNEDGGIDVTFDLTSVGEVQDETLLMELQDAVNSGQLGTITVEPGEVDFKPGEVPGSGGSGSGGSGGSTVSVHQSSVTLPDEPYSPALADPESQEFMQLAEEIQQALEEVYSAVSGDQRVSNIQFVPNEAGGIDVIFDLTSVGEVEDETLLIELQDAVNSGQLGTITVQPEEVDFEPREVSVHQSSVTLPDESYSPALADPESQEFMQLAEEIQQALEEVYSAVSGDQRVSNIQFVPNEAGGIDVTFDLTSVGEVEDETLLMELQDAVNSGQLGTITVEPGEVDFEPGEVPGSGSSGDRSGNIAQYYYSSISLLDTTYSSALANPSSEAYTNLAEQIIATLEDLYRDTPGEQLVTIEEFVETDAGYVEVLFQFGTVGFYDNTELFGVLTTAVTSGQVGSYTVSPENPDWQVGGEDVVDMYRTSIFLEEEYDPALSNTDSPEYKNLEEIIMQIEALYDSLPGYQYVANIQFMPTDSGYIEVVFDLGSVNFYNEEELQSLLQAVVDSGQLGTLVVSPQPMTWITYNDGFGGNTDPNPRYAFLPTEYTVHESHLKVTLVITRTGDTSVAGSIRFYTINGEAQVSQDFERMDIRIYFEPGQPTKTVEVVINADEEAEFPETFGAKLLDPEAGHVQGPTNYAQVTILDDDSAFVFEKSRYIIGEETGTISIAVQRKGDTTGYASVEILAVGDGAILRTDFEFDPTTLHFAHGDSRKIVSISIVDDSEIEATEAIICKLSNPRGAKMGIPKETRILLEDDDGEINEEPNQIEGEGSPIKPSDDSASGIIGIGIGVAAMLFVAIVITVSIYVIKKRKGVGKVASNQQQVAQPPLSPFSSPADEQVLMSMNNFILKRRTDGIAVVDGGVVNPYYSEHYF